MYKIIAIALFIFSSMTQANDEIYTSFFSNKALDGYDAVSYFNADKPQLGNKKYKTVYKDTEWYFISKANLELFKTAPENYEPQYGGHCAWAVAEKSDKAPGDPTVWTIVNNKLYLNYNRDIQEKWEQSIPIFIASADKIWPTIVSK